MGFNGTAKHMLATRREVCLQGFGYCSWRQTPDEAQVLTTPRNACKVRKFTHGTMMLPVCIHLPTDKRGCQWLRGQKKTEMKYCIQLCADVRLPAVTGRWGGAVLVKTPIRM